MVHVDVTLEDVRIIGIDRGDGDVECFICTGDYRATVRLTYDELALGLCLAMSHSGDGPLNESTSSVIEPCSRAYDSLVRKLDALALDDGSNPFRFIP